VDYYDDMAIVYDSMIEWDLRIKRELPLLAEIFKNQRRLLDIACSTGRHAEALADKHEIVGIDINKNMIDQAINQSTHESVKYYVYNALDPILEKFGEFDGAYILANSLANMGSLDNITKLLENLRKAIPNGMIFGQTVYLDNKINYLPLRHCNIDGKQSIIQRIMFPNPITNIYDLHFNIFRENQYYAKSIIPLYPIRLDQLKLIANKVGWKLKYKWGSYNKGKILDETGKPQLWVFE